MQMRHGFAGVRAVVEHEPIAAFLQPGLFGDFCSFKQEMAEDLMIFRPGFAKPRNRLFGNDENMLRRLGFDILKSDYLIVFVHDHSGNFAGNDFLEQGFAHVFKG